MCADRLLKGALEVIRSLLPRRSGKCSADVAAKARIKLAVGSVVPVGQRVEKRLVHELLRPDNARRDVAERFVDAQAAAGVIEERPEIGERLLRETRALFVL
jgi:hypothetical protein